MKNISHYIKTYIKSVGKYYYRSYCRNCRTKINNIRRANNPRLVRRKNERDRAYYYKNKKMLTIQHKIRQVIQNLSISDLSVFEIEKAVTDIMLLITTE